MELLDPRTLEREYDPRGEDLGRARGGQKYPWYVGTEKEYHADTSGITPEQVDLSGYEPLRIGCQSEFPVYGPSGGLTNIRWRAWRREEAGRHYVIVFEDYF